MPISAPSPAASVFDRGIRSRTPPDGRCERYRHVCQHDVVRRLGADDAPDLIFLSRARSQWAAAPRRTRCVRHIGATAHAPQQTAPLPKARRRSAPIGGLLIETPDRCEFFGVAKLGPLYRGLQHADGTVVDLQRHGIGMPVLAAMGDRKSRRVTEAIGRAMDNLGDLGERADGPRADARTSRSSEKS